MALTNNHPASKFGFVCAFDQLSVDQVVEFKAAMCGALNIRKNLKTIRFETIVAILGNHKVNNISAFFWADEALTMAELSAAYTALVTELIERNTQLRKKQRKVFRRFMDEVAEKLH